MNGDFGFYMGNQILLTQYSMLPAGLAQSGDQYQIGSSASKQLSSATSVVSSSTNLTGGGPATISFPTPWSYAGPTPAALPAFNFSYTGGAGQSVLDYSGNLQWAPESGIEDVIDISLTQNYQSASPSVAVPDLSAIPGFLAAPASGTTVLWYAQIGSPQTDGVGSGNSGSSFGTSGSTSGLGSGVSSSGNYTVP
jgi:hypothetical protein